MYYHNIVCVCVHQCQCYNALVLSTESTLALYGTVTPVPEGKQVCVCRQPASGRHDCRCVQY